MASAEEKLARLKPVLEKVVDGLEKLVEGLDDCQRVLRGESEAIGPQVEKHVAAVKEETFTILRFDAQQGTQIGNYEVAYRASNIEDKWRHALSILRMNNSTIASRYHGEGYVYSYWLYGQDKIYRQKQKKQP
jgi:hypothetical protein